ncbi:MAG TPA: GT4 family glycosyltransferase PelF [Nitrospiraceae bacterium]|nr:GT4 family glycosyltransferase PelF [Nitrospiraceae bacterium]
MSLVPPVSAFAEQITVEPIRLLKFLAYLAIGGSERQVFNIRQGLDRSRFDLHLGCFGRFDEQIPVDLTGTPLEVYKIGKLYGPRAMKECFRLRSYLRRHRIDVVHAYNFYANVFAVPAARLARVPVVLASIRDTGEIWTENQRAVNRMACRLADRVVVNAETIKRGLVEDGYRPEQIVVVHNGIICPPLKETDDDRILHRERGLSPDDVLIGVVCRIARVKGLEYLLDAARDVIARVPRARFVIIGDNSFNPEYREELKRQTARLGMQDRVIFTGFRLDVQKILSSLAVSVLPSLKEGLSNALLESMAAGLPVVATDVGGNPEVVIDGETGLLVPAKNPSALAEAICRVLLTPGLRQSFGQAGRRRVLDHFSNERMIRTVERLYVDLLEASRRKPAAA